MTWQASKPSSGECGDFRVSVITDEHGWVAEVRAEDAPLVAAAPELRDALEGAHTLFVEMRHILGEVGIRRMVAIEAALSRCRPSAEKREPAK